MLKRFIQLAAVVGGLGLLACASIDGPNSQAGANYVPPVEVAGDTTALLSVVPGR